MIEQASMTRRDPQIRRAPNAAGLYDILDLILDKGIVIDAFVRVSLVGIELVTVDARIVIASVDTYLRYAEGAERLQLYNRSQSERIPDFIEHQAKRSEVTGVAKKGLETAGRIFGHSSNEGEERDQHEGKGEEEGVGGRIAKGVKNVVGRLVHTVSGDDDEGEEQQERQQQPGHDRPGRHERQRGNGHGKPAQAGARR